MNNLRLLATATLMGSAIMASTVASAAGTDWCAVIDRATFIDAAKTAYAETNQFGFGLPMWATLVNQVGQVCYVYSVKGPASAPGGNGGFDASKNAWLGSRVISAQKANTANAFSLNNLAISTGGITAATYEGGSLFGLQASNPVDATVAYAGDNTKFGTATDPLMGQMIGGVNLFGGGVALYAPNGNKIGGVGASGDTSCRDHTMAWRMRIALGLDNQPNDDGLTLVDTSTTPLSALFQQPACGVNDPTAGPANSGASDFGIR
jgi:uncharacterized protein GlcG (DUF336 family)